MHVDGFAIAWAGLAIAVFWAVGAHNRLVRLRSQTSSAFSGVNLHLAKYINLVRDNSSSAMDGSLALVWRGIENATTQFEIALQNVSGRPLDAAAMGAMQSAYSALCASWERFQNEPQDLAGDRMPEALQHDWAQLAVLAGQATDEFNRLVTNYNEALSQFPVNLLAGLFGFQRAKTV